MTDTAAEKIHGLEPEKAEEIKDHFLNPLRLEIQRMIRKTNTDLEVSGYKDRNLNELLEFLERDAATRVVGSMASELHLKNYNRPTNIFRNRIKDPAVREIYEEKWQQFFDNIKDHNLTGTLEEGVHGIFEFWNEQEKEMLTVPFSEN